MARGFPTYGHLGRVLVYERNDVLRGDIVAILEAEHDIAVVAEVAAGGNIGELIKRCTPNVVVSGHSGVLDPGDWPHGPKSAFADLPVVVMCDSIAAELDNAVRVGARGIVLRSDARTQLVHAVREVLAGNAYIASSVAGYVLDQLGARLPAVDPVISRGFEQLTSREREVLRMIAGGMGTAEVAKSLHRSSATVKSHISHLLAKLGVQDRAQAIALAYQVGLISVSNTTWISRAPEAVPSVRYLAVEAARGQDERLDGAGASA